MKNYISPEIEVIDVANDIIANSGYGTSEKWNDFINKESDISI